MNKTCGKLIYVKNDPPKLIYRKPFHWNQAFTCYLHVIIIIKKPKWNGIGMIG